MSRIGGDPGREQLEINEITDWFKGRGANVFLMASGIGRQRGGTMELRRHSAYIALKGSDSFMYRVEGKSYLEAARAAKQKWEEDGLGVYLELAPSEAKSNAALDLTTATPRPSEKEVEARRASRRETVNISWEPLPGVGPEGAPVHLLQVTDPEGVVVDVACGDDPEDSLLEVAEKLMPSWHKNDNEKP